VPETSRLQSKAVRFYRNAGQFETLTEDLKRDVERKMHTLAARTDRAVAWQANQAMLLQIVSISAFSAWEACRMGNWGS
jgi:hypothetical protein